nr:chromatin remodeling protein EBS-like isoform X1 [Ipomoea batatas]
MGPPSPQQSSTGHCCFRRHTPPSTPLASVATAAEYHPACVGMSVEQTKQLDQFVCSDCASDPNVNDDAATFSTSLRLCE